MAKHFILYADKYMVYDLMNGTWLVDIEFDSDYTYNQAVQNGFNKEKFEKFNPGMKVLIKKEEDMKKGGIGV